MDINLSPTPKTKTIAFRVEEDQYAFLVKLAKKQKMALARVCQYIFLTKFLELKPNLEKILGVKK